MKTGDNNRAPASAPQSKKRGVRLLSILWLLGAGCSMFGGEDEPDAPRAAGVSFQSERLIVPVEGGEYLRVFVTPPELQKSRAISWEYDETKIAVDPDTYGAVVTGVGEGETYVKAKVDGLSATALVTVQGFAADYTTDPYLYSNYNVIELAPGDAETVSVSLYGGQSWDLEAVSWTVSDPSVASISTSRNNAVVHALKTGSAQITATHPNCAYGYTMIAYVHADALAESHLTTESNVVSLNTADASPRTLAVSVQNPSSPVRQSGFSWSFVDASGALSQTSSVISLSANGETALVAPLSTGLQKVRVSYDDCAYPLDILVRVTTTVANVYITPSTATLTVSGGSQTYTVYADVTGYAGFADPDAFAWTAPDGAGEFMDFAAAGNAFSVKGKKNGSVKVKVSHPLSETSRSILIILQEQEGGAVDAEMYVTTSGNYVQTQVGAEAVEIQVSLVGGAPGDEADFEWRLESGADNGVIRVDTPTGSIRSRAAGSYAYGKLIISPLKPGVATISVTHPKTPHSTDIVARVYSQYAQLTPPVYLSTDANLIKMLNGSTAQVTAALSGAAADGDENGVTWRSDNDSVVSASPSTGALTILTANGTGSHQTYVTAAHPKAQSEKRVLALSADTQQALDAMKCIYADAAYLRVNEGASAALSLNQIGLSPADVASITWTVDKPSVAMANAEGGDHLNATVTGVSPGVATVTAALPQAASCVFTVTVLPAGEKLDVIEAPYLTTAKNAVVLPSVNDTATLSVTGVNISPSAMASRTTWRVEDPSIVSASANGASAAITALAPGGTRITASNPDASNTVTIDVTVGPALQWSDPAPVYIAVGQDVVAMARGAKKTVGASLANSSVQDGFSFSVSGKPIVEATGTPSGTCLIEALEAGVSEITITNSRAAEQKEILVVVANSEDELRGIAYLTTRQNVVTVGERLNATVTVAVQNAPEQILSGYSWTSSDPAVVEAVSSGAAAVLYGRKAGVAKITVANSACPYPLEIIANCVDPVAAAANPYIVSQNIVTLAVGAPASTVTAELIGGSDGDASAFSWFCDDASIVQLHAANDAAQLKALKEGVAQLVIRHPKAGGADRTVLVICEPPQTSDCYITTSESIIRLSPSDSAKTISAALANGKAGDERNFKWWADDYSIIDMNYTGSQAIVTPLASGSVAIHVSHPKALYQKDIVLNISQYDEFAFEKTQASLTAGVQSFINMRTPVTQHKTRVSYAVKRADGSGAASTVVSASGTDAVCVLDPHAAGSAIVEASLVAVNSGAVQSTAQLLVSISPAPVDAAYINFAGSTIITLEKGVTKTLSAALAGTGAAADDSNALQWKSSDQSVLRISPVSASNVATRKEIQIAAMQAGREATITVHHEKANSDIVLYVIIPGENAASVTLDKSLMSFVEGESPAAVSASIANAEEKDYENLVWTLANKNESRPAASLSGTGRTVSVRPLATGQATLTARVPSSGKTASCEIEVEQKKQITFSTSSVTIYPGGSVTVGYTVSPNSEAANLVWTIGDGSYAACADNRNGTITLIGKDREGSTYVEATSLSGARARFTVNNKWGDVFALNKTAIAAAPVGAGDDAFTVVYNISPACAELHISTGSTSLSVTAGASSVQYVNGEYVVYAGNHQNNVDPATGIATGSFRLSPSQEVDKTVRALAYNPRKTKRDDGTFEGADIAVKTIAVKIGYDSYTFSPTIVKIEGKYSRWNAAAGALVLGDGEGLTFSLSPGEARAAPSAVTVSFEPNRYSDTGERLKDNQNNPATPDSQRLLQRRYVYNHSTGTNSDASFTLAKNSDGNYTLYHTRDYGSSTGSSTILFGVDASAAAVEKTNAAVRAAPFVGVVKIAYTTGAGASKTYEIPLYVEVRNCPRNY